MSHRFSLPTDVEMEKLITQVYESLPKPEQSRLSLVESKLLQKARKNRSKNNLNKMPWWIVLVLVGGFASAAWWAADNWSSNGSDHKTKAALELQSRAESDVNIKQSEENKEDAVDDYQHRDTPIIYQREHF